MARALGDSFQARGWQIEVDLFTESRAPVVRGRLGSRDQAPLLLIGHIDTVLPAVTPKIVGDELHGTGALDMKGGWAALLGALDLLTHRGRTPPQPLALLAVPDEEIGGPITHEMTARDGSQAREIWVLEPGEATPEGETLVLARRGRLSFQMRIEGQAAHAGLDFWQGRSAALAAAAWVVGATALSQRSGPDACTVNVARLLCGTVDLSHRAKTNWQDLLDPAATNVVPDLAELVGEARYRKRATRNHLVREFQRLATEIAEHYGVQASWRQGDEVPPVEATPTARKRAETAQELAAARGWHLSLDEDRGGISFPNFLTDPTIPVLDGLGPTGVGMHTRNERLNLTSLARRIVLLADLLEAASSNLSTSGRSS